LFHPGNSIASTLANEFTEAAEPLYLSSLMELGLILLCITFLIQVLANIGMARMRKAEGTGN
ncbi:MAG: phosphate ABC transporter permease subunit PstC, partial [Candidatus Hydrogenedentota bacterium]